MRYFCIMPAAGGGQRFGEKIPKQYHLIQAIPMITHALRPFIETPQIERVVVVLAPEDTHFLDTMYAQHPKVQCATGGKTRLDSVRAGLCAVSAFADPSDYVLVHDAARPFLDTQDLKRLMIAIGDDPVGGIFARSVTDTLKCSTDDFHIKRTEPRAHYWLAQTPQMFRFGLLSEALTAAGDPMVTDESEAIERLGYMPKLIEGPLKNIKITFPTQF